MKWGFKHQDLLIFSFKIKQIWIIFNQLKLWVAVERNRLMWVNMYNIWFRALRGYPGAVHLRPLPYTILTCIVHLGWIWKLANTTQCWSATRVCCRSITRRYDIRISGSYTYLGLESYQPDVLHGTYDIELKCCNCHSLYYNHHNYKSSSYSHGKFNFLCHSLCIHK